MDSRLARIGTERFRGQLQWRRWRGRRCHRCGFTQCDASSRWDYSAEELLTGKREEITQIALKSLSDRLAEYGSGVAITDLQMQRVTPPERVKPAFDEVNASIQQRDQLVNEAYRERNQMIPSAEAQRDRLIREAEGYASRELAEAQGEISALLSKYESYKLAPEITKQRMYIEMMEKVLQQSGRKSYWIVKSAVRYRF